MQPSKQQLCHRTNQSSAGICWKYIVPLKAVPLLFAANHPAFKYLYQGAS